MRALAVRWAEIAALPVMAERKRAWRALHDLRPERPMILFEVGTVDQYVRADELRCTHPVLRAGRPRCSSTSTTSTRSATTSSSIGLAWPAGCRS